MAKRRNQKQAKEAKLGAKRVTKKKTKQEGAGSFRAPKRKAEELAAGDLKRAKVDKSTVERFKGVSKSSKLEDSLLTVKHNRKGAGNKSASRQALDSRKKKFKANASKNQEVKGRTEAKLKKSELKARLREHKCVIKKNFGLVQEVVVLWEKLRPASVTASQKSKLVRTVLQKTKGKIAELVKNHRASRVVQFCLKEGSQIERIQIMQEVKDNILNLSKDKYGRHLVLKLINYLPEEYMEGLVKLFQGHVMVLLKHNYGADVIADLYHHAAMKDKNSMVLECYGKELSLQQLVLFDSEDNSGSQESPESHQTLENVLSKVDQIQRVSVLRGLTHNINYIVEKGLLHPHLVHMLVMEYLHCASTPLVQDLVHTISETGDGVMKMLHTREGAAAASMVLAYGSSKVRKTVIRGFKDYVKDVATDEWGHIVIVTMLGVVDDTTLLNKVIVKEIQSNLKDVCMSQFGSRVILKLLNPDCKEYIPQEVMDLTRPKERIVKSSVVKKEEESQECIGEAEETILGVSLKSESSRLLSLLSDGKKSLVDDILDLCLSTIQSLLRSQFGANVLFELACGGGGPFSSILGNRYQEIQKAIVQECLQFSPSGVRKANGEVEEKELRTMNNPDSSIDDECENQPQSGVHQEQPDDDGESSADLSEESEDDDADDEIVNENVTVHDAEDMIASGENTIFRSWNAQNLIFRILEQIPSSAEDSKPLEFANLLWHQVFKGRSDSFVGKPGEVILASLVSHSTGSLNAEVKDELSTLFSEALENWQSKLMKVRENHRVHLHKKTKKRKKRKLNVENQT